MPISCGLSSPSPHYTLYVSVEYGVGEDEVTRPSALGNFIQRWLASTVDTVSPDGSYRVGILGMNVVLSPDRNTRGVNVDRPGAVFEYVSSDCATAQGLSCKPPIFVCGLEGNIPSCPLDTLGSSGSGDRQAEGLS